MSFKSGLEEIPAGGASAVSVTNSNITRINDVGMAEQYQAYFWGNAQANIVFAKTTRPYAYYIEACEFNAFAGPPSGSSMILGVKVGGTLNSQTFSLTSGAEYLRATATGDGIYVAANTTLELILTQVGSAVAGFCVGFSLQLKKKGAV